MEPLSPNDPLWKLLGQSRPVEPRSNFSANVMREVRNTPQETGWWARVSGEFSLWLASLRRPALIGAAAFAVVALLVIVLDTPQPTSTDVAVSPPASTLQPLADEEMALIANDSSLPFENLDHMEALVAMDDTSSLTDSEIAFLLY
jgi:hypothetical protein